MALPRIGGMRTGGARLQALVCHQSWQSVLACSDLNSADPRLCERAVLSPSGMGCREEGWAGGRERRKQGEGRMLVASPDRFSGYTFPFPSQLAGVGPWTGYWGCTHIAQVGPGTTAQEAAGTTCPEPQRGLEQQTSQAQASGIPTRPHKPSARSATLSAPLLLSAAAITFSSQCTGHLPPPALPSTAALIWESNPPFLLLLFLCNAFQRDAAQTAEK